MFLLLSHWGW